MVPDLPGDHQRRQEYPRRSLRKIGHEALPVEDLQGPVAGPARQVQVLAQGRDRGPSQPVVIEEDGGPVEGEGDAGPSVNEAGGRVRRRHRRNDARVGVERQALQARDRLVEIEVDAVPARTPGGCHACEHYSGQSGPQARVDGAARLRLRHRLQTRQGLPAHEEDSVDAGQVAARKNAVVIARSRQVDAGEPVDEIPGEQGPREAGLDVDPPRSEEADDVPGDHRSRPVRMRCSGQTGDEPPSQPARVARRPGRDDGHDVVPSRGFTGHELVEGDALGQEPARLLNLDVDEAVGDGVERNEWEEQLGNDPVEGEPVVLLGAEPFGTHETGSADRYGAAVREGAGGLQVDDPR